MLNLGEAGLKLWNQKGNVFLPQSCISVYSDLGKGGSKRCPAGGGENSNPRKKRRTMTETKHRPALGPILTISVSIG